MRLTFALKEKEMDLRLRDKHIAEGKVTKATVDQYLSSLPDDSANLTTTDKVVPAKKLE